MNLIIGFIKLYRNQVRSGDNLMRIIPSICMVMGFASVWQDEYIIGLMVSILIAIVSFLVSVLYKDWIGGIILAGLAFGGEAGAILVSAFPLFFLSLCLAGLLVIIWKKKFLFR